MKRLLPFLVVAAALAAAPVAALEEATAADKAAAEAAAAGSEARARAIVKDMAHYLASQQAFSFTTKTHYDSQQADGQKLEFGDTRKVTLRRPDRLRVDIVSSDGRHSRVLFDGKQLTAYSADANVYAQSETAGTLDAALAHYISKLRMRMPLAALLTSRIEGDLAKRITSVEYVELSTMCDVPCHHVAGRTETTDVQAWIAAGDAPVPLRFVITYKDAPGQPQFRADFSEWNVAPDTEEAIFVFVPPPSAVGIPFAANLVPATAGADGSGDQP